MIKIKNDKGVKVIIGLLFAVLALAVTVSPSFAAAIDDRTWITNQAGGQVAAAGNCRFTAYYKGADDYIQTEDSWNAVLGYANSNTGYTLGGAPAKGWCDTNASYYPDPDPASTDTYDIWMSSIADAQAGHASGTVGASTPFAVPTGNGNGAPLALLAANYLAEPGNIVVAAGNTRTYIRWDTVAGATGYKVYRGPVTGVGVGAGIYQRIADTSNIGVEDASATNGTTYYYIVLAYDATRRGVHTNQLAATPTTDSSVPTITPPLSPTTGAVGTVVTITGTNFGGTQGTGNVYFNGTAAASTDVTGWAGGTITVKVPAGATTGSVYVVNSSNKASNGVAFTVPVPSIPVLSSVTKNYGYNTARTVAIVGTGFTGTTTVSLDAVNLPTFTVNSDTSISVTIPAAQAVGQHYIRITNGNGTSATGAGSMYTVVGQPTVTSVTPSSGLSPNTISIGGTNLFGDGTDPVTVTINGSSVTFTSSANNTTITNIAVPSGLTVGNSYRVIVTNPVGASPSNAPNDLYTITAAPTVTNVNPPNGVNTGTTPITITGTNFTGATWVHLGATNLPGFTVQNATTITVTVPAGLTVGTYDITVNTAAGTSAISASDQFTVTALPTVTNVNPPNGVNTGTTPITITGTNFTGATWVHLGATDLPGFAVVNATTITVTVPAGLTAGTYDITVNTAAGTSATSASDHFTVTAPSTGGQLIYEKAGGIMMAYPNPFNPNDKANPLKMLFNTATGEAVDIYIFDTNARIIYQRRDAQLAADREARWDGETSYGEVVENGLYLIRIVEDGKLVAKGKILVIKK